MKSFLIVLVSLVVLSSVQAGPPRRYRNYYQPQYYSQPTGSYVVVGSSPVVAAPGNMVPPTPPISGDGADALAEVNATRAQRGLKPFINDPLLNKAAQACAQQRASRHIHGHLPESDFSYVPSGGQASAAGCGALELSWGWGTCCTYDNYTYAGAAWVMGNDGRRYMHLFVR